jgi:hypothetical protein
MLPDPAGAARFLSPQSFPQNFNAVVRFAPADASKRSGEKEKTPSPIGEIPVEYLSILTQSSESLYFGNMRNSVRSAKSLLSGTCVDQEVQDVLD